jgi:adenylate cyclase, class 2
MLEVENKYRCEDWDQLLMTLQSWGATLLSTRKDSDHYFNAPDRDFAQTDEAVRLRRIGPENFLTYKGPKLDHATKTRTELELPLANGPEAATTAVKLLTSMGYKPVAVVNKTRQVWKFARDGFEMEACFDDVGAIGKFVELEIMTIPTELEAAKSTLLSTASELRLTALERRSYLQLLLESSKKPGPFG